MCLNAVIGCRAGLADKDQLGHDWFSFFLFGFDQLEPAPSASYLENAIIIGIQVELDYAFGPEDTFRQMLNCSLQSVE